MFHYLSLPQAEPDPVLETPDMSTPAPSAFPSQPQDTSHASQPLHFPMTALPMSLVQTENQTSSQKFETTVHNPSVSALLQQAQHVQAHRQNHEQNHNSALAEARPCAQSQGLFHRSHLPLTNPSSHALPIPLLPPPQPQQQVQPSQLTHPSWPTHQMPLVSPLLSSPPQLTASRQLPVGELMYNAPSILPSSDIPHLPPVSLPSTSRDSDIPNVKRHRAVRRRLPIVPHDFPHRSPRKTRSKRSFVWKYFDESKTDPNVALCTICNKDVPRGRKLQRNTTNLQKHLQHKHPEHFAAPRTKAEPLNSLQAASQRHESPPAQSETAKNLLNFPLAAPKVEQLHIPTSNAQVGIGYQSSLGNDRHNLAALSVAAASNGPTQDGGELNMRRALEESSAVMQYGTEKLGSGSNINFSDHMAMPVQYRGNSFLTDRARPLEQPDAVGKSPFFAPILPSLPLRLNMRSNNIERQSCDFPGSPTPLSSVDMTAGMLEFLAIMDLPLAASNSKAFEALFSATRLQGHIPNLPRLRTEMLLSQKTDMGVKVKKLLSEAENIIIAVEATKTCRILLCRYFTRGLTFGHLCLEVISWDDTLQDDTNEMKASVSDIYPSGPIHFEKEASGTSAPRRLLDHIDKALEDWGIRDKVTAIITPEREVEGGRNHFLFRKSRKPRDGALGREGSDSSRSSRQASIYNDMHKERSNIYNGTAELGSTTHDKIPVVPCFASIVEKIAADTICANDTVNLHFIEPMSKGLFKVLSDRSFLASEDFEIRPVNLKLPLTNLSMSDMLALLNYFLNHLGRVQAALRKQEGDSNDIMDILRMDKGDLRFLEVLVRTFSESLRDIRDVKQGVVFRSERMSIALPAMKQILQKVETICQGVGDILRPVAVKVFQTVKLHCDNMESQEVYTFATLLDPRFKLEYFTSKEEVAAMAEAGILDAYEGQRQRKEERRHLTESAGNLQNILEGPSSTLELMDSMMQDRRGSLSISLSAYLQEPIVGYGEDIEAYWRERQQKWPLLFEIATQYALIPSTCDTDRIHSPLGDYHKTGAEEGNDPLATHSMTFLKTNLLLVEGNSLFH